MQDFLSATTKTQPRQLALVTHHINGDMVSSQAWTYGNLNQNVARLCTHLSRLGVTRGDFVGVLMPPCEEYVLLIHALLRLGGVLVALNTRLTKEELAYQTELTGCAWLFYTEETKDLANALDVPASYPLSLANIQKTVYERVFLLGDITLDDLFAIVFTSGTSGKPKAAMLSVGNFYYSALASQEHIRSLTDDRWLCVLPLFHVGGLSIILRSCICATAVDLLPSFDLERVNLLLRQNAITLISLVPTQLYRLLEQWEQKPPTLRLVLLGGAPADESLIVRSNEIGLPIATTYGLTEACSQVATALPHETAQKIGTVGKPLPRTQIGIVDENGQIVPNGTIGEVIVAGQTVMMGYYNDPEATAKTLRDGVLYTGDLAYLDDDNDLWLVQRRSDLIMSGGENIYPAEVESALKQHPAVKEACIVGIPDPEWGQSVVGVVVLYEGQDATPQELLAFLQDKLARYKQPRALEIVEFLPITASGKVSRSEVIGWFTAN